MGGLKRLASLARGFAAKAVNGPGTPAPPGGFKHPPVPDSLEGALGAFASVRLLPIRPRSRGARRSLRTFPSTPIHRTIGRPAPDRRPPADVPSPLSDANTGVQRIIAVASGKGGVGKSTTAVNLACAAASSLGLRVGILDADVFGPSVPILMNLASSGTPAIDKENRMLPLENYGVKCMSMGFLIAEQSAAVWRGPMVMGALGKMIRETKWHPLDVLFVDMPPGTGDAQISISQRLPLTGAVIVSTPQEIALADARRGVNMYSKVNTPILGFVENMSYYAPPGSEDDASARAYIFGKGGVKHTAEAMGVELLAEVPLDQRIRERSDEGRPIAVSDPESAAGRLYAAVARRLIEKTTPFVDEGGG